MLRSEAAATYTLPFIHLKRQPYVVFCISYVRHFSCVKCHRRETARQRKRFLVTVVCELLPMTMRFFFMSNRIGGKRVLYFRGKVALFLMSVLDQ